MKGYKTLLPKEKYYVVPSLKKRGFAFLIDVLIFFFLILTPFISLYYEFAGVPVDKVTLDELMNNEALFTISLIGDFISYSIFFFYLVSSEYLLGATIGKRVMSLTVIDSRSKKKPNMIQLMIRNSSKSLFIMLLPFDIMLLFFDSEHKRLLDYASHTLVVENRKRLKKFPVVNEV